MEHQIDGTELVPKKLTRQRFRKSIFEAWQHNCAYCGCHATTIDHVKPVAKGGLTIAENCVPACLRCNASKSFHPVYSWWTTQDWWCINRAKQFSRWIHDANFEPGTLPFRCSI